MNSVRNAVMMATLCLIVGCSSDDSYTAFDKEGIPIALGSSTRAGVIQRMVDDFSTQVKEDKAKKGMRWILAFDYTTCRPSVGHVYRKGYHRMMQNYYSHWRDEDEKDYEGWFVRPLVHYTDEGRFIAQRIYHPDLNKQCDLSSEKLKEAYKQMMTDDKIDDAEFDQLKAIYLAEKKIIKDTVTQIQKSIDDEFKAKQQKAMDDKKKAAQARNDGAGVVFYK